jgi:hypothetical protein
MVARLEVFMSVNIQVVVFWVVTPTFTLKMAGSQVI